VFGRRLLILLLGLAAIGVPAGVLRAACAGKSCTATVAQARVPFCPLPAELKAKLAAGFREGRSPDVMAVARSESVRGGAGAGPWPSVADPSTITAVPIAFFGTGIRAGAAVPVGTGLDAIAPTLSEVLGFRRPHPDVRAGTAVDGVANGERPRLVLEIAWKGVGTDELRADPRSWPSLRSLMERGAGTLAGDTGSLPLDPAATLTTIGTGGLPSQHGITGTLVRNAGGQVVEAWGPGSPFSVIATLPDDLDEAMDQRPMIGLVARDQADRGIIGGNWYIGHDRDAIVVAKGGDAVRAARRLLAEGFGHDDVPDILAVVLDGSVGSMDRRWWPPRSERRADPSSSPSRGPGAVPAPRPGRPTALASWLPTSSPRSTTRCRAIQTWWPASFREGCSWTSACSLRRGSRVTPPSRRC